MSGYADELGDPIRELIQLGERLGFLTYEMVNAGLGDDVLTPQKLDSLLMELHAKGIRLVDEPDALDP